MKATTKSTLTWVVAALLFISTISLSIPYA